jgi:hypothetical protein
MDRLALSSQTSRMMAKSVKWLSTGVMLYLSDFEIEFRFRVDPA